MIRCGDDKAAVTKLLEYYSPKCPLEYQHKQWANKHILCDLVKAYFTSAMKAVRWEGTRHLVRLQKFGICPNLAEKRRSFKRNGEEET